MKGKAGIIFKQVSFLIYLPLFFGPLFWPLINLIHFYPEHAHLITFLFWQCFALSITLIFLNITYTGTKLLHLLSAGMDNANEDRKNTIQRIRVWKNIAVQNFPAIIMVLLIVYFPYLRSKISYMWPIIILAPTIIQTVALYVIVPPAHLHILNKNIDWFTPQKSTNQHISNSSIRTSAQSKMNLDQISISQNGSQEDLKHINEHEASRSDTENVQMYVM